VGPGLVRGQFVAEREGIMKKLSLSWGTLLVPWVVVCLLTLLASGCGDSPTEPTMEPGSWYVTGFRWPHDGDPFETENFIVFSDGASKEARRTLGQIAEGALAEVRERFGIPGNDLFHFPPGQGKIHIFAYKNHFPQEWGGQSYYGGLLIYSLDHEERGKAGHTETQLYTAVVEHELVHVFELLVTGGVRPHPVHEWFSEGIAELMSGGTAGGAISSPGQFEGLVASYGELNPIAIHSNEYPDVEFVGYYYFYPMFHLALRYLIDPAGRGRSCLDARDLWVDVGEGIEFSVALRNRFGLSESEFEDQFFQLMRDYLPSVNLPPTNPLPSGIR
jgi:hypothetical protein